MARRKLFSQRYGYSPAELPLQLESMNDDLRVRLWNTLAEVLTFFMTNNRIVSTRIRQILCREIFDAFLKREADDKCHLGLNIYDVREIKNRYFEIKNRYFNEAEWFHVYDFIEFIWQQLDAMVRYVGDIYEKSRIERVLEEFYLSINRVLEEEYAGYRLIDGEIVPVTSEIEIQSIAQALKSTELGRFNTSREHLKKALSLFSDREAPDYENSIKEAISALEALARELTGKSNATLGEAIPDLAKRLELHPALVGAINKLYGYASDESGIRHSKKRRPTLTHPGRRPPYPCPRLGPYQLPN